MNEKNEAVRGKVDAVNETILLALKEGAQSLKNTHVLSGINYNTFRLRLYKLDKCLAFAASKKDTNFR
ncbi:hypothetical protein ACFLWG_00050 [Chloroflexota bacterium]